MDATRVSNNEQRLAKRRKTKTRPPHKLNIRLSQSMKVLVTWRHLPGGAVSFYTSYVCLRSQASWNLLSERFAQLMERIQVHVILTRVALVESGDLRVGEL